MKTSSVAVMSFFLKFHFESAGTLTMAIERHLTAEDFTDICVKPALI